MSTKVYKWSNEKNVFLKKERGISFEEVIYYLNSGYLIDIIENTKYKNQSIFVIDINGYIHLVPFKETEHEIILITIFKSRKATKKYLS